MKSEFIMAINQICSERNLPQEIIFEAIELALVSAYRRNFGSGQNIKATIDTSTGRPHVFAECIVVDQVEDERFEMSLKDARKITPDAELGTLVRKDITPRSFGRIAAQTAKQVILQRIREAERDALFTSYVDREGELINGMVANITAHSVTLNLGRTEAVMPRSQQVPGERYRIGQRVRAYVMEVKRTNRGPQIVVSRTHRHMLRRLLELEVPEIFNGTVEIKAIAREAGSRSKVAVAALQNGVDPVGSCVGIRGMRIQSIVSELGGEKIDVVAWNPDTSTFIANALSPAKVNYALLGNPGSGGKTATVVVPDDQLSLAIGKEGQNARLAAKLTGWRIDIKSYSEAEAEGLRPGGEIPVAPGKQRDILAMAEAILLGKEPAPAAEVGDAIEDTVQVEPISVQEQAAEITPEPETTEEPQEQELSILTKAEALLRAQEAPEPLEETQIEAAVMPADADIGSSAEQVPEVVGVSADEGQAPEAEMAVIESEAPEKAPTEDATIEPEPVIIAHREPEPEPGQKSIAEVLKYEYVKDESLERLKEPEKRTRRRRRRQLVLDEETGQLISRRRHKRGDADEYEWEDR